ncbi:MAG: hypothetical protein SPJ13_05945 [Bacteroidales bacterium]|nr:hypothetical protein [Bacteroidales bacterium]
MPLPCTAHAAPYLLWKQQVRRKVACLVGISVPERIDNGNLLPMFFLEGNGG